MTPPHTPPLACLHPHRTMERTEPMNTDLCSICSITLQDNNEIDLGICKDCDTQHFLDSTTPPQPAHGEPWQSVNADVWDAQSNLLIRDARYDMARNRAVECVNKLMFHPDLSAIEVHSKETMDKVRRLLAKTLHSDGDSMIPRSAIADALAKLNPPQG